MVASNRIIFRDFAIGKRLSRCGKVPMKNGNERMVFLKLNLAFLKLSLAFLEFNLAFLK